MTPRFDPDARDRPGATHYLHERAHQALTDGFTPDGDVTPLHDDTDGTEWGVRAFARSPSFALWLERLDVAPASFARWFEELQVAVDPIPLDRAVQSTG